MNEKPIQWEIMAAMEQVQKDHPEWTEEQCREEFSRLASAGVQNMLNEQAARRNKRKRKPSSEIPTKGSGGNNG